MQQSPLPSNRCAARLVTAAFALALVGCGGGARAHASNVAARTTPVDDAGCANATVATLGRIGKRIYSQAVTGRNVHEAAKRLGRSLPLRTAVADGSPRAVQAALKPLLKSQIRRIIIRSSSGRVLATSGRAAALAQIRRVIVGPSGKPVGSYVMSVSFTKAVAGITRSVTGADVVVRAGAHQISGPASLAGVTLPRRGPVTVHGDRFLAFSYPGRSFPAGSVRITMLIPRHEVEPCSATSREEAVTDTIGAVGQRLYDNEATGGAAKRVARLVARDAVFQRAVKAHDAAAVRARVVHFFRDHNLHVVRIRAVDGSGRLVNDVGGPFALAPVSAPMHRGQAMVGTVTLSVQDDTGYIKLMHRFTGVDVLLRTSTGQVPGSSLTPGPATIPANGSVVRYHDSAYRVYSLTGVAFPTGALHISLLVPGTIVAPPATIHAKARVS